MVRQVVYVAVASIDDRDERTKALESACNWDWLAEYRLIATTPSTAADERIAGYYLFFERD